MKKCIQNMVMVSLVMLGSCSKSDPSPVDNKPVDEPLTITSITPMKAVVGAKVVIAGTGFSKTTTENSIKFGNTAAVVDSASQTRLVTRVPLGAQGGKISVMVNNKTVSSTAEFEVSITATQPVFSSTVGANATSEITTGSAKAKSTIDNLGSEPIIQHGHVWVKGNQTPLLTSNTGKTELGQLTGNAPVSFSSDLKNLDAASTYTVRAYITTPSTTIYGDAFVFTSATTPVGQVAGCRLTKLSVTTVRSSGGEKQFREIDLKYDANGRISQMTDSKGATKTYEYDNAGRLVKTQHLFDPEYDGWFIHEYRYDGTKLTGYRVKTVSRGSVSYDYEYKISLSDAGLMSQVKNSETGEELSFYYESQNLISWEAKGEEGIQSFKLTYDQHKNAFQSIFISEAHKIDGLVGVGEDLNSYFSMDWSVNNILTFTVYNGNVQMASSINSYTYDSNGYPNKAVAEIKDTYGNEPRTVTLTLVYDKCP